MNFIQSFFTFSKGLIPHKKALVASHRQSSAFYVTVVFSLKL
ncbi:hypothetical protein BMWSH_2458 [Priestia megaterium WSH-002]|uniref:Uncharacterized protein n=1 Tax=Priestia megaterium (strain WSH-002) TaxID=1006007 RepID=A0A8D3X1U6_PRIMW|nr:hypothetical protein BMWSH_2458 [Priestia megaterium WSH-002]